MIQYEILNVAEIESPALAVYLAVIASNIQKAVELAGNNILRPHIKTCKTAEVVEMMLAADIRNFKCATLAEAELLGMVRATDVLLAYQMVAININRFKNIIAAYPETNFSCLLDNAASLKAIETIFDEKPLNVFIDLNTGMNRTGLLPKHASAFVDVCLNSKGVALTFAIFSPSKAIHFTKRHLLPHLLYCLCSY